MSSKFLLLLFCSHAAFAFAQAPRLRETWETGYVGGDATGKHVLGYWKFDEGAELQDSSGKGHELSDHGAKLTKAGRFGGALESFAGFPVEDKSHGLHTDATPGLSPKGAFTIEMWISAKAEFAPEQRCFLLDKKYVSDDDYQWTLGEADKAGNRRMTMKLGFGAKSDAVYSEPLKLEAGVWHHVAFTYDAEGKGRFYFDGQSLGGTQHAGLKSISPGGKPLSLGDRIGSNYSGFPGFIDEVRLCDGVLEFGQVKMQILTDRTVWRRMEPGAKVSVLCRNLKREPLQGARLVLGVPGLDERSIELPVLEAGAEHRVEQAFNTALKAGEYPFRARLELTQPKPYTTDESVDLQIVNRPLPNRMPVVMWGGVGDDFTELKNIGFTHCLGLGVDEDAIWKAHKPVLPDKPENIAAARRMLDKALANDVGIIASVRPSGFLENKTELLRVDRAGKPYARKDICASLPEMAPFFENVGATYAQTYGGHPAFQAALVDTEVRDNSTPSFNAVDVANYKAFSGADIPAEVMTSRGVSWKKLPAFPEDRIIADDDPILKYYRWFWTVGDGWNSLHTAIHKGVKSTGRGDLWTFFDPAVRCPSISGSGGAVDVLSHWTYTYPDPLRIGLAADELFEMARANGHGQRVMKMTQLIWYRSQTAPLKASAGGPKTPVAWEDHDPDAAYITTPPVNLREALWTKLSRPIQGIMYHGWGSLVKESAPGAYRYTNPHTQHELKRLIHEVVEPLGPTLMQIPEPPSEVAFLESFTSQMFAGRGGYGSNLGWSADVWLALQHAHVQCDVMFEESLLKGALAGRKLLVMPECEVLTKSVVETIKAWQAAGGKVIGDEFLCPAIKADVTLASFKRVKKAAEDKAQTLKVAAQLLTATDQLLTKRFTCDNPEVVVHLRRYGTADYVFVVNDHREAGTYVGQYGLVMENGLPSAANIIFAPGESRIAYDLTKGEREVPPLADRASIRVNLGPGEGTVFMLTPEAIREVAITGPAVAKAANAAHFKIRVNGSNGSPLAAISPLQVTLRDANGRLAEGSGYYGAKDGQLNLKLDLALNEDPGVWEINVRELASRKEAAAYLRVTK